MFEVVILCDSHYNIAFLVVLYVVISVVMRQESFSLFFIQFPFFLDYCDLIGYNQKLVG